MKTCSKCKAHKPRSEFNKCTSSKDGLASSCRACMKEFYRANREKILAANSSYYAENKDTLLIYQKEYRELHKEKIAAQRAEYRANNKEKVAESKAKYYARNKDEIAIRAAEYRAKNPDKKKASDAAYYAANREKCDAQNKDWAAKNPDKRKEIAREWAKRNPEILKLHRRNRRARKANAKGVLSAGLGEKLFNLQKGKCPCCKQPLGDDYHMDHIVPISKGGSNTDDNIQLLRATCNRQKNAKYPEEFMRSRGFLI